MATTWYFRDINAPVGPTGKASTDTDTWPAVPSDKNTAKAMSPSPGTAEHNDGANQYPSTTTSARYSLGRIFVGPPLAAQTLTGSQAGFVVACGIFESSASMNLYNRIFAYVWRSGSGNVKTIGGPVSCATEHTAKAEDVITFSGAAGDFSILANDRIVVELWSDVRNSKNTTYTATHYYDGTDNTMADGSAPTASQCGGYFYCPQTLTVNPTTKTASLDSYLQSIYAKTPGIDGVLQKLDQTKTPSIDSYLFKSLLGTLNLDAILILAATTYTKTVSLDSFLSKLGLTRDSSFDALLQKLSLTKTVSLDSFVYKILTKTLGIDAYMQKTETRGVSADSLLNKVGLTKSASIDSFLQKFGLTKNVSVDALLQKLASTTATSLDAILYVQQAGIQSLYIDGLLQKMSQTKSASIDGFTTKGFFKTPFLDSLLSKTNLSSVALDAMLRGEIDELLLNLSIDSLLLAAGRGKSLSLDAVLLPGYLSVEDTEIESITPERTFQDLTPERSFVSKTVRRTIESTS